MSKCWNAKQEPILIFYIWNEADQAAVVGFKFLIDIQNCQTILVKMMGKVTKSVKNKGLTQFCELNVVLNIIH